MAFNVLFYLNTLIYLIVALPTFFMPYRAIIAVAKSWGRTNLVLLRVVAGIDCEIRGRDKLPKGPLIVASKHQSAWETFALLPLLENPVFILKRELQWIPVFASKGGWNGFRVSAGPRSRDGLLRFGAAAARRRWPRLSSPPESNWPTIGNSLFSPKVPVGPPVQSRATRSALSIFIWRKVCRAFRSRSIPACSGRADHCCGSQARSLPKFLIRSRQVSKKRNFSSACGATLKARLRD